MNTHASSRRTCQLISLSMLTVGLGSAVVIYLTSANHDESDLISEFEGSKRFAHDLELYGGKANVIADKFARWFVGLWQGQSLAFTVAVLTVVISAGYFLVASRLLALSASEAEDDSESHKTRLRP